MVVFFFNFTELTALHLGKKIYLHILKSLLPLTTHFCTPLWKCRK